MYPLEEWGCTMPDAIDLDLEERCTCPWPTIKYVCPLNPNFGHFCLELFATVSVDAARMLIIRHLTEEHGANWADELERSEFYLAHVRSITEEPTDPFVSGSRQRAKLLSGQWAIEMPGQHIVIAWAEPSL